MYRSFQECSSDPPQSRGLIYRLKLMCVGWEGGSGSGRRTGTQTKIEVQKIHCVVFCVKHDQMIKRESYNVVITSSPLKAREAVR